MITSLIALFFSLNAFAGADTNDFCARQGGTICSGACTFTNTDNLNCGSCNFACPWGSFCSYGSCVLVCPAGYTDCSGACVNTNSDPNNCGGCTFGCSSGVCADGTCRTVGNVSGSSGSADYQIPSYTDSSGLNLAPTDSLGLYWGDSTLSVGGDFESSPPRGILFNGPYTSGNAAASFFNNASGQNESFNIESDSSGLQVGLNVTTPDGQTADIQDWSTGGLWDGDSEGSVVASVDSSGNIHAPEFYYTPQECSHTPTCAEPSGSTAMTCTGEICSCISGTWVSSGNGLTPCSF
jgi:hypothetical protein